MEAAPSSSVVATRKMGNLPSPFLWGFLTSWVISIVCVFTLTQLLLLIMNPGGVILAGPGANPVASLLQASVPALLISTLGNTSVALCLARLRYDSTSGIGRYAAGTVLGTVVVMVLAFLVLAALAILLGFLAPCPAC